MQWDERIGRRLKLRDVNILLAVVQWGGMAKAARRLAVSQPVVSKAIADSSNRRSGCACSIAIATASNRRHMGVRVR